MLNPHWSRRIPLAEERQTLFGTITDGKPASWMGQSCSRNQTVNRGGKLEQSHRIEACKFATIDPPISFYALSHTYATMLGEAGIQLLFVADALEHTDPRMVAKHYAHLAPSYNHDSIRANLPTFGVDAKPELPPGSVSESPRIVFHYAIVGWMRTS